LQRDRGDDLSLVAGQEWRLRVTLMSKSENDANNVLRPSDSPMNEHEKEKIAQRKTSSA
jgi:hypothetical protein